MARSTALAVVKEPEPVAPLPTDNQLETELPVLIDMLEYKRPAWSRAEKRFIARFIRPLGAEPDGVGNYWCVIPREDGSPSRVMWSSHTDTVHSSPGIQTIVLDRDTNVVTSRGANCLGADCTTGVWLMRQMIIAKVPGVYIFHRAEEVGGRGSAAIASRRDPRLDGVDFAIAFDRKGFNEVITHQVGMRCASQTFVNSIVPMLPAGYVASDGGSFTDTANYVDTISECTNLSVGYLSQHSSAESQSLSHAAKLALFLMRFDESRLVSARDPQVTEYADVGGYHRVSSSPWNEQGLKTWDYNPATWTHPDFDNDDQRNEADRRKFEARSYETGKRERAMDRGLTPRSVLDVVKDYPHAVADYLEQCGYDAEQLINELAWPSVH